MGQEFERQAMACTPQVFLGGNVPYIYNALAQSVHRFRDTGSGTA